MESHGPDEEGRNFIQRNMIFPAGSHTAAHYKRHDISMTLEPSGVFAEKAFLVTKRKESQR